MSRLLRGPKISSRHQSYTETAKKIIEYGQKSDSVTKVILGPITNGKGKTNKLKLKPTLSGVEATVVYHNQIQVIYLIGDSDKIVADLKG